MLFIKKKKKKQVEKKKSEILCKSVKDKQN